MGVCCIEAILESIDACDIFACDLTFRNYNVLFELGYAIAKNKRLMIMINPDVGDGVQQYAEIEFLKSIGYSCFNNGDEIVDMLDRVPTAPSLLSDLHIEAREITHDVFYIQSLGNTQAKIDVTSYLKSKPYSMIADDPDEVSYRSSKWYIESIFSTASVIVHITDDKIKEAPISNAKASLLAGIARGSGKLTVFLSPFSYTAPIDYTDYVVSYADSAECTARLKFWAEKNLIPLGSSTQSRKEKEYNLITLGIGYDVAENEKDILSEYFIETSAYAQAIRANRAFFVGRKGAGKTAIYLMLDKYLRQRDAEYVVSLKPETSELLDNVEVASLYSGIAQESSFFYSIWKFVIYSKTLLAIEDVISKKPGINRESDSIDGRLLSFIHQKREILKQHFLETIRFVASQSKESKSENKLEKLHKDLITPMAILIKEYVSSRRYMSISILADNLDKTWDTKFDLSIQAKMIESLFEATERIETELYDDRNAQFRVMLFLRQDIFEYIRDKAREPDKLTLYKHDVDWSSFPDQLRNMIEKRFSYLLNLKTPEQIQSVWDEYFALRREDEQSVFDRLRSVCLPRPRDMLMFIGKMFESAVNNSHLKVEESDFIYARTSYSEFLDQNLIAEMTTEYPFIKKMLNELRSKYTSSVVDFVGLSDELKKYIPQGESVDRLFDALVSNEYFQVVRYPDGETYRDFHSANEAQKGSVKCFSVVAFEPSIPPVYVVMSPKNTRISADDVPKPKRFLQRLKFRKAQ